MQKNNIRKPRKLDKSNMLEKHIQTCTNTVIIYFFKDAAFLKSVRSADCVRRDRLYFLCGISKGLKSLNFRSNYTSKIQNMYINSKIQRMKLELFG